MRAARSQSLQLRCCTALGLGPMRLWRTIAVLKAGGPFNVVIFEVSRELQSNIIFVDKNRVGPSTLPCGIPSVFTELLVVIETILIFNIRFDK